MILPSDSSSLQQALGRDAAAHAAGVGALDARGDDEPHAVRRVARRSAATKPSVERSCSVSPVSRPWRTATSRSVCSGPTPSETPSIGFVSASSASTSCPARANARAMVPDTVVLPTPPFPATTIFIALCYLHLARPPTARSRGPRAQSGARSSSATPARSARARPRRAGTVASSGTPRNSSTRCGVGVGGRLVDDERAARRRRASPRTIRMIRRAVSIDCHVGSTTSRKRCGVRRPVERRLARAGRQVAEDDPVVERAHVVEAVDDLVEGVVRGAVGAEAAPVGLADLQQAHAVGRVGRVALHGARRADALDEVPAALLVALRRGVQRRRRRGRRRRG